MVMGTVRLPLFLCPFPFRFTAAQPSFGDLPGALRIFAGLISSTWTTLHSLLHRCPLHGLHFLCKSRQANWHTFYIITHTQISAILFCVDLIVVGYQCPGISLQPRGRNHPSSLANPQVVSSYIQSEVQAHWMVGPIPSPARNFIHCSPVGLVPKGRNCGRWRMIVDLSSPHTWSVNDGILESLCSLKYPTVNDAIKFISLLGRNTSKLIKECVYTCPSTPM